jgi:PAS domain S-box-containing protein
MNTNQLPFLIPYLLSAVISFSVALFAWQRRRVAGALPFALVATSQAAWTMGYLFELNSEGLAAKIFWDDVQFVATLIWPVAFLAFTRQYTGRQFQRPRLAWALILTPLVLFLLLLVTDKFHGLIRPSTWLIPGEPFDALMYEFTTAVWLLAFYGYGLIFTGLYLLITRFIRAQRLYRQQVLFVVVGALFPVIGTFLTLVGVTLTFQRDTTPVTFAISNLLIAWGLFRYRLFDIVPVARDVVFEGMSDIVLVLDAENRLVDINRAAQRMFGRSANELIGKPAAEVLAAWGDLAERFHQESFPKTEIKVQWGEETQYLALRITPLRGERQRANGRIIVARDVTDRKRVEQAIQEQTMRLQVANEELRVLSQVKDEFVANVSHELRTPLTNIKLYHDLLLLQPEKQRPYLEILRRETERLEKLIEDLLTLSRLDRDAVKLDFRPIDLNQMMQELVADRQLLIESYGLHLMSHPCPDAPQVQGDHILLAQVLSILLTNATTYTPAGGCVNVHTQVAEGHGQNWAGFSVQDNGPGIAPDEQNKLFTRFFRGSAAQSGQTAGTGLGLAIAKEIVERHHGRIEVSSEGIPGKGATFYVWLPG